MILKNLQNGSKKKQILNFKKKEDVMNINCKLIYKCKNCGKDDIEMPPTKEDRENILGIIEGNLSNTIQAPNRLHRCEPKKDDNGKSPNEQAPNEFGIIELMKIQVEVLENAPEGDKKPL